MTDTLPKSVALPVAQAQSQLWYADGLRFSCHQCGNCCSGSPGYVWLSLEDMKNIAAFLKVEFETFTKTYVRHVKGGYSLIERANYDCIFLRRENGKSMCGIYPVRPTQCRTWPFWNDNLKSQRAWADAATRCPGMADPNGTKHELPHIEKCRTHDESP
jgi:uncharacterized protein